MSQHVDALLWSLVKDGKVATAVLRRLEGYGFEARLLLDGSFRQSQLFKGDDAEATQCANAWREKLVATGWTSADLEP